MYSHTTVVVGVSLLSALYCSLGVAQSLSSTGVHVGIVVLKQSSPGPKTAPGPVLIGPQVALDLEWNVVNNTGAALEISSPGAALRLRVSSGHQEIPVRTEWATDMTVRSNDGVHHLPVGSVTLPNGTSLSIRGSTQMVDENAFSPGEYTLQLLTDLPQGSASGTVTRPRVNTGFPIRLQIVGLTSTERWRQFHLIEAGFYKRVNSDRALEHYAALATMPGAIWSDSLPLATMYSDLGRHREASAEFRRVLPDLIRSLETSLSEIIRPYFRIAAMSFAADGDTATAAHVLRLEGRTPPEKIPEEIERLRKSALSRRK